MDNSSENKELINTIAIIFEEVQRSKQFHKQQLIKLISLLNNETNNDIDGNKRISFMIFILKGCLDKTLIVSKKNEPNIDRVINFICDFIVSVDYNSDYIISFVDTNILSLTLNHLLLRTTAKDKTVRWRSISIISSIIKKQHDKGLGLPDEIYNSLNDHLLVRLNDKIANVRIAALQATSFLHNQEDENDLIRNEILNLMSTDPSKDVRLAAVVTIPTTKFALNSIINRIKDVNSEVRIAALQKLQSDVSIRHLTEDNRAMIIQFGLKDRDKSVVIETRAEQGKVSQLLNYIGLVNHEEEVELLAYHIMDELFNDDEVSHVLIPNNLKNSIRTNRPNWNDGINFINCQDIYWANLRCDYAFKHFSSSAADELKDNIIPDIVKLCQLLSAAHESPLLLTKVTLQLSVKYLLRMTSFIDSTDHSGANELVKICTSMLKDIYLPECLLEPVIIACNIGIGLSSKQCIQLFLSMSLEISSSHRQPVLDADVDINEDAKDEEEEAFLLSSIRGLLLIEWCLQHGLDNKGNNKEDDTSLYINIVPFLLDSLAKGIVELRGLSIRSLGLLTITSSKYRDDHHATLLQAARAEVEVNPVRVEALKALVDMAIVYNEKFQDDAALTNLLLRLYESSDHSLVTCAIESTIKLLFINRLTEPRLLSHLLKFFTVPDLIPQNEDIELTSAHTEQLLSVFFQTYYQSSDTHEEITLNCISDLISDASMIVRDGDADAISIHRIVNQVIIISSNNTREANSLAQTEAINKFREDVKIRLVASLLRESLKLGNSSQDKITLKELCKACCSLSIEESIDGHASIIISKTVKTIIRCCKPDKTSLKLLTNLYISCDNITNKSGIIHQSQQNVDGSSAVGSEFLSLAPGLADLLDLLSKEEDEIVGACQDIIVTKIIKKTIKKDNEEESDDEEEVAINRPSRSCKVQASSKIAAQVNSDSDEPDETESDDSDKE